MKKLFSILLMAVFVLSASSLFAGDYNGASKCIMCHKKRNESHVTKVQAMKHWKAFESLKAEDQKKAECVVCHTTGFGNGGYEIKDAAFWANTADKAVKHMADLQFVGCEACHTDLTNAENFSNHKKRAYKPVMPTEETCKTCHNKKSPNFKEVNFKEEMEKLK